MYHRIFHDGSPLQMSSSTNDSFVFIIELFNYYNIYPHCSAIASAMP